MHSNDVRMCVCGVYEPLHIADSRHDILGVQGLENGNTSSRGSQHAVKVKPECYAEGQHTRPRPSATTIGAYTFFSEHVKWKAYLIFVFGLVSSSNRMEYPTCSPSWTSISSATRLATDMAATRRGCVHATMVPGAPHPVSNMNCGICVVFPEPVSPTRIVVWCCCTMVMKSDLACHTGKPAVTRTYMKQIVTKLVLTAATPLYKEEQRQSVDNTDGDRNV